MGVAVDWRRSFITTDVNPYYDSFVRWQFETLREKKKVAFGKRYTIYSAKDGQPCADHDRQSGEGVVPQEYTLIKLELIPPLPAKLQHLADKKIYLVPGTLRPETMYGQTNCWVLPDCDYGAFEINDTDVFICTKRAAKNLAYQNYSKEFGVVKCLAELKGWDILGIPVKAPLSKYPVIYTLPMLTINPNKGTGIVTCVPSDAPDDYMCLEELKRKPAFRQKFNISDEKVMPYNIIPIINVPSVGNTAAATVCNELKIKSPNDRELLDAAKETVYQKGFYEGTMLVGEFKGRPVKDAKPLIKDKLIANGDAIPYSEPASPVISRSGDECVVSLTDQWFLDYGEENWRAQVESHLKNMEFYSEDTKRRFEIALGWLNQWACSRTYGLGSRLPWDPQYLIESLSDSTIYMAYYTVAHLLQGKVDGSAPGLLNIKPEQLTRKVWDYIFLEGEYPADSGIPEELLKKCRAEFKYWYPLDLRVSGKDLITNHLTFFLYNHVAFWPQELCPRSVRANGHILLNGEKMSKSTGNFLTLTEAVDIYTADGMRIGLADAGDSLDDANFSTKSADSAILRLYTQLKWTEDILANKSKLRTGELSTFADKVFANEINRAIRDTDMHYEKTNYREALRTGFFELQSAKDAYVVATEAEGQHLDLIMRFIEVQAILLCPFAPHFTQHIWKLLGKQGFVQNAAWPTYTDINDMILKQNEYLQDTLHTFRLKKDVYLKPRKGKSAAQVTPPVKASIMVAKSYPEWMEKAVQLLKPLFAAVKAPQLPNDKELVATLSANPEIKQKMKQVMSFVAVIKEEWKTKGMAALELKLSFDEKQFLESVTPQILKALELKEIEITYTEDTEKSKPGKPYIQFQ